MKNILFVAVLFAARTAFSCTDITTGRMVLVVPCVGSYAWGPTVNDDLFAIDAAAASQFTSNSFISSSSNTFYGPVLISNTAAFQAPTNAQIAYFSGNTQEYYPQQNSGLAIAQNFSQGNSEMDIWNTNSPTTYPNTAIRFLQQTGVSSYKDVLFLANGGNVGIGTTSPGSLLDVNGTAEFGGYVGIGTGTFSNILNIGDDIGPTGVPQRSIVLGNQTGNSIIKLGQSSLNSMRMIWKYNASTTSAIGILGETVSSPLELQDTGGPLGIGTATPINALDVNGAEAIGSYAGVNTAPTDGLIVSGNVGIGTTAPAYSLDVSSYARVQGTLEVGLKTVFTNCLTSVTSCLSVCPTNYYAIGVGCAETTTLIAPSAFTLLGIPPYEADCVWSVANTDYNTQVTCARLGPN